ncbi:transmembrane protein 87B isoform X1 [Halyomorpha halys]|uniref:transmembrane protein 87B isoform X1 n=1 Tax=Halyomorpha halys TaxID=286706 RepID=UPI0006D503CE|nr:transmembrane protein 87B [Halyomorpha halys]
MECEWICLVLIALCLSFCNSFPEQGKWDFVLNEKTQEKTLVKSLFKGSQIFIQVSCKGIDESKIKVVWTLRESTCWRYYQRYGQEFEEEILNSLDNNTVVTVASSSNDKLYPCSSHILLEPVKSQPDTTVEPKISKLPEEGKDIQKLKVIHSESKRAVYKVSEDGFYILSIHISAESGGVFKEASVHVEMKGTYGYLSAANWPLLPFYGAMCLIYVSMGAVWLAVSFLQWRDLLRIQFWIGGVIFLGMLEVATFYAEYSNFNSTGLTIEWVVLTAEIVSCAKRTLARMLVIIVSLGFGIVKPRLGPMLHRVVCVGMLYFILAVSESYMRVVQPKKEPANQFVIATVPLAVLDSAISWWIFISLAQTTRTLRLRRNLVKLTLYRHFTNILIFAVVASVMFMLYSIKAHSLTVCFRDWKELWIDDAYWRLLFSIILIVIMFLWRPTNNNQRYAFSPLLDAPEDDDDDDEEEQFVNDAYGVKMRAQGTGSSSPKPKSSPNNPDEDLKWVEENIPASLVDTTLPILDSDEEIMTTKFELSKMQ